MRLNIMAVVAFLAIPGPEPSAFAAQQTGRVAPESGPGPAVVLKGNVDFRGPGGGLASADPDEDRGGVRVKVFNGFEFTTVTTAKDGTFTLPVQGIQGEGYVAVFASQVGCQPESMLVKVRAPDKDS